MLHQEGNVLTQIPSDEELCDSVLKELGSRRNLAAGLEEVCDVAGISFKEMQRKLFLPVKSAF